MSIQFLTKPIEDKTVLWMAPANQYLVLENKTAEIVIALIQKKEIDFIGKSLANELNIPVEDAISFIKDVNKNIVEPNIKFQPEKKHHLKNYESDRGYEYKKYYRINNTVFLFEYQSYFELELVHPKFTHLETREQDVIDSHFQIFSKENITFLYRNKEFYNSWDRKNIHYLQGKVSMLIVEEIYEKPENEWLGVFHASAVSDGDQSMLFLGDSGNGKSTSLALLQAHNFNCIADDFVPMAKDKKVYTFPSAISLKKNSWDMLSKYFPKIKTEKEYYFAALDKTVRYLPPSHQNYEKTENCNILVFIKYAKESNTALKKISKVDAFHKLLPDSWISKESENVETFLDWFQSTTCYSLTYSDNQEMIDLVSKLFSNDL